MYQKITTVICWHHNALFTVICVNGLPSKTAKKSILHGNLLTLLTLPYGNPLTLFPPPSSAISYLPLLLVTAMTACDSLFRGLSFLLTPSNYLYFFIFLCICIIINDRWQRIWQIGSHFFLATYTVLRWHKLTLLTVKSSKKSIWQPTERLSLCHF